MTSTMEPQPGRRERAPGCPWVGLGLLFLALLPALLRGGLALDDRELIFENPATSGALGLWETFGRDYFHHLGDSGQWRPLASLSLRLDRFLFGDWITGYHLANGVLQVAVVGCANGLLRSLGLRWNVRMAGLIVFALHPALADSVVWIAGRTSMLSALFPLAGAWGALLLTRAKLPLASALVAGLGLAAGLLAKEDALIFAVLLPCLGASISRRDAWRLGATSLIVVGLLAAGRGLALGSPLPSANSPALGDRALAQRLLVGGAAWLEALRLALLPVHYPPQYREAFLLARLHGFAGTLTGACIGWGLASVPLVFVSVRRAWALVPLATVFSVLSFLPVTHVVPLGEVFAPRFLYLPLLFSIPLMGTVLERLLPVQHRPLQFGTLALLLSMALFARAGVYRDAGTWADEMLRLQPSDVRSWNARGLWLEEQGDSERASEAWRTAIELDPNYSRSWSNLGRAQMQLGDLDAAQVSLRAALRAGPRNPIPCVNLASLLLRQGDAAQAAHLYEQATRLRPGLAAAWRGLALAREALGEHAGALAAVAEARRLDPGDRAAQTLERRLASPATTPTSD